jgi:glucuronate isomerase
MSAFIHDDFLLPSERARRLYHEHAAQLPIVDYHSHVSARDLARDRQFANLVELWIAPDQYKHRAMRTLGVAECFITGDAPPEEKFAQWAASVPRTLGNPLFHWTAIELRNYFGVDELLSPGTAAAVWQTANAQLQQPSHRARALLQRANVELVCSSDLFLDSLEDHAALAQAGVAARVVPSLRADDALAIESGNFIGWARDLGAATRSDEATLEGFQQALERRMDVFAAHGCTISDHGIDVLDYTPTSEREAAELYSRRRAGATLSATEAVQLRSAVLLFLGRCYARRGWAMQLHLGAQRQTSSRLRRIAGAAGGYATIGRPTDIARLCRLLDDLESAGGLPRTVLYTLNPADNAAFATITGSFAEEGVAGKVQFGPAWWFNDHELGIRTHLETLTHHGLLWTWAGMTTDSRSLLSMSRHDYFRRVFCSYLAHEAERGAYPADEAILAEYVRRVCYENPRAMLASPTSKTS